MPLVGLCGRRILATNLFWYSDERLPTSALPGPIFRFGVFELSVNGGLRKSGATIKLARQPTQVLLLLVERAGDIVTREEIQQLVWSDQAVVDFEVGINRCIRSIRSTLLDSAEAPRYLETIPRVGYRFLAPVQSDSRRAAQITAPAEPVALPSAKPPAKRLRFLSLALIACAAALAATLFWSLGRRSRIAADLTVVPLAVSLGDQLTPTFSPDGRQVAFTWNGDGQDNFDIYLKLVNSSSPAVRLTTDPDVDYSPAWSPDGQWIAFCRGNDKRKGAIWIKPALGGVERRIVDLDTLGSPWNRALAWSQDSQHLIVSVKLAGSIKKGLHSVNVFTGASHQITSPTAADEDMHPAVSPDGRTIAFTRDTGRGISSILLTPLPGGMARTLPAPHDRHIYNARPTWTPDSSHIAFVSNAGGESHVWLAPSRPSGEAQVVAALGTDIQDVVASPNGQLGIVRQTEDSNIWSLSFRETLANESPRRKRLFASRRVEESPTIRSDDRQIAFASNRSGFQEIWTGRTDGSDATQVTYLQNPVTGSPDWSPDARHLVFDSRAGERPQLYLTSTDGGQATALPAGEGVNVVPHWSVDGRHIYFSSDRTGRMEIWRTSASGGVAEQITSSGGFAAVSSRDGQSLYYASDNATVTSLWAQHIATGQRVLVTSSALRRAYAPSSQGVYFIAGATGQEFGSLFFYEQVSGRTKLIRQIDRRIGTNGMTLSPDERTLYYTQMDDSGRQLLLVPHFWQ